MYVNGEIVKRKEAVRIDVRYWPASLAIKALRPFNLCLGCP